MKRLLVPIIAVLVVGAVATACDATPQAASVNGTTIATSDLNAQLATFENTAAGQCLLSLEAGQAGQIQVQGAGGAGTFDMAVAGAILDSTVNMELAEQYAASRGLRVTSSDVAATQQQLEATLEGEIDNQLETASQSGSVPLCVDSSGQPVTGAALLAALPASMRNAQIRGQAVDDVLLADGADLSDRAVAAFYHANLTQFQNDCVSRLVTATEADANQDIAQIEGGASFADVAKAHSIDTSTASAGGAIGCNITQATVLQDLGVTSAPVGTPLAPIQDPSSGAWEVYEVTSQTVESLASATKVVRQELPQQMANRNRVSKEITAFARRSDVSVNPQYGTWKAGTVVPPLSPPARYLLGAVSGQPPASSSNLGGPVGSSGTTGSG